ncbi:MAG TPA: OmpA family protein [Candidatus Krumholzibacteria bacterium]|nr:OmpA family protein [Candidatus Krumholzibacteria bacterium]HPD72373.1 OmpA family protein [Candidatus Krumholzibacteria bacterium]HRY40695.1 OmpA family protein [Candidatus Krumholzibacteria bacterium]
MTIPAPVRSWLLVALVVCLAGPVRGQDEGASAPSDPLAAARVYKSRASQLGAKGTVPAAWQAFVKNLEAAERDTLDAAAIEALELEGRRLVNRAAFLREVRDNREPLENLLGRYDRALRELAAVLDIPVDPALSGDEAAARLLDQATRTRLQQQLAADSLRVENRKFKELIGSGVAARDSLITALQVELSAVRKRLWETELRAGVAEADRSAAESALSVRQAREEAVREILDALGDKATAVTRPDGTIILQVHGLTFGVGSASLEPGQAELMKQLAAAVARFPGAAVRVEGHTDDTGSRAANLTLSERRAATVAGGIERRLKLAQGSIATAGVGPDRPIAPNSTAEGRARNRRIDIVIAPVE